ncbi:hypothetical protein, partial [Cupriavidus sp. amp6]|uniref:hypothetical protein n=1 Tax=Cupriavidus sp. amp6 TaxID=388051 RepID=UPI001E30F440
RVKVGHRQALIVQNPSTACAARGFCFGFFVVINGTRSQSPLFSRCIPGTPAFLLHTPSAMFNSQVPTSGTKPFASSSKQ